MISTKIVQGTALNIKEDTCSTMIWCLTLLHFIFFMNLWQCSEVLKMSLIMFGGGQLFFRNSGMFMNIILDLGKIKSYITRTTDELHTTKFKFIVHYSS